METSLTISLVSAIVLGVGFVVTIGSAAVWLRSALGKQRNEELSLLVDTRGERIKDLETELRLVRRELTDRIVELETKYKHLLEMFESDMAQRIGDAVTKHLTQNGA